LSHALIGAALLVTSALSLPAQARPSDPFWHPLVSVPPSTEKPCGPIVRPAWYGPRGGGVIVGHHAPCPQPAHVVDRWVGPRGTIPVYR
jgi:hypothetical protein